MEKVIFASENTFSFSPVLLYHPKGTTTIINKQWSAQCIIFMSLSPGSMNTEGRKMEMNRNIDQICIINVGFGIQLRSQEAAC